MDLNIVFIGTVIAIILAMVLGVAISFVTQFFYVEKDPRIEQVYEILPHFNCGACGYPGCMPYAEAVCCGDVTNKCRPGGVKVAEAIQKFLEENSEPTGLEQCENKVRHD